MFMDTLNIRQKTPKRRGQHFSGVERDVKFEMRPDMQKLFAKYLPFDYLCDMCAKD